jgi:hypothetical protein
MNFGVYLIVKTCFIYYLFEGLQNSVQFQKELHRGVEIKEEKL